MFAGAFVVLFLAVIVIVVVCVSSMNGWRQYGDHGPEFWKRGVVYQVYPRSFADSDGDGTGDLKGIAGKVEYLKQLGVEMMWLSPVYESPMKDFGYDISNYTAIDPIFGTMEDFDDLLHEVHKRGLKMVMDFVPNHSSDQHEWFKKSEAQEGNYTHYYLWADSIGQDKNGTEIPPNNWTSEFGGSAWQWSPKRKQFYYHQFLKEQPDLNYRSEDVRREMMDVLRFWLKKGVDGFRVDALKYLVEVKNLTWDEPVISEEPLLLDHIYTENQPETFEVLREWRELVDEHDDKVLMVEVYSKVEDVMKYYGNETAPLADFPFNFFMLEALTNRSTLTGYAIKDTISLWLDNMPEGKWPNWVLGNHDNGRVGSRLGKDLIDALNMVLLLLPGTPVTYYGEEIGMLDAFISWNDTVDPSGCNAGQEHYMESSRDPERTPMQWNDGHMAGFTSGDKTWLPINPNYKEVNVDAQKNATQSHLKFYKRLTELLHEEVILEGELSFPNYDEGTFSFIRSLEGYQSYLVVVNTAEEDREVNLHHGANLPLPEEATVVLRSSTDDSEETSPESEVSLEALLLLAGEGILLQLPET